MVRRVVTNDACGDGILLIETEPFHVVKILKEPTSPGSFWPLLEPYWVRPDFWGNPGMISEDHMKNFPDVDGFEFKDEFYFIVGTSPEGFKQIRSVKNPGVYVNDSSA